MLSPHKITRTAPASQYFGGRGGGGGSGVGTDGCGSCTPLRASFNSRSIFSSSSFEEADTWISSGCSGPPRRGEPSVNFVPQRVQNRLSSLWLVPHLGHCIRHR